MLILSRKIDEEIIINSNISIKILSISESSVKIGISAPSEVEIFRGEIYEKVKQSTIDASAKSTEKPENIVKLKLKLNKIKKDSK